ncbi:sugar transport protein 13 [Tanacetum coccineum]
MEKIDVLKSVLKSSSAEMTNIASKIKNIKGKIRMPIHNVTFVQPLNDVTKPTKLNPNGEIGGLNSVEHECTTGLNMSNAVNGRSKLKGMVNVIENGPWLIRRMPLILNVWTPNTILKKEEIKLAPIWVKLHHVPIVAYLEVGLSLISTQIRRPIMMDSYTSNICLSSWGRSTYARVLIEVSADKDLMESMVVAIPLSNGKGHSFATIDIAYEWKPPRCSTCAIFDHVTDQCPKNPKVEVVASENEDGFTEVKRKKSKAKQNLKGRHVDGVRLNKPPVNFYYRKVEKGETSKKVKKVNTPTVSKGTSNEGYEQVARKVNADKNSSKPRTDVLEKDSVVLKNSFSSLGKGDTDWEDAGNKLLVINDSDSESIDEELVMEEHTSMNTTSKDNTGASTPDVVENNLSICAILESHVSDSNLLKLCPLIFHHWNWTSNGSCCLKGTRIILGWNHNDVDIVVINQDDQNIHVRVWLKLERNELFCSFVYAYNRYVQRRELWKSLCIHKHYVRNSPWCILGDFNAALFLHDSSAGNSNVDISMREFKECVEEIEVMDVQHSGLQFTWSQKPKGKDGLLKKIDRVMANLDFNDTFTGAHTNFKPYCISDHSPSILNIPTLTNPKPKPFKFYNIITSNENFAQVVKE